MGDLLVWASREGEWVVSSTVPKKKKAVHITKHIAWHTQWTITQTILCLWIFEHACFLVCFSSTQNPESNYPCICFLFLKLDSGIGSSRDCLFMNYLAVPDAAVAIMHSLDAAYSYFWQELSSWGAVLLDVTGQNMNTLYCFSCRVRVHPLWGQF